MTTVIAPMESETTSLLTPHKTTKEQKRSILWHVVWCLVGIVVGILLTRTTTRKSFAPDDNIVESPSPKSSKYKKVQGLGFQIYTGGAPAYLDKENVTHNPDCQGKHYGTNVDRNAWLCYVGFDDPLLDVQRRLEIMIETVQRAYDLSDKSTSTLKVFIAPEFYWRGPEGAYLFQNDEKCGPICHVLRGLESLAAQPQYEDWLFVFGTVVASEQLPQQDIFDYLYYNFAPVYKGGDYHEGNRFLVPKRYVSSSDFLTPKRWSTSTKQLVFDHNDTTIVNPFDLAQKRYDNDIWLDYKQELKDLGYHMIEYDWVIIDDLTLTIEVCFDHDRRTALNSYLADIVTKSTTRIPNASSSTFTYSPIPNHQAQISIVSSAGMQVTEDSLALTNDGVIFLQDGLSNDTNIMYFEDRELQFDGGTEAVQRRAILSPTDVYFEYNVVETYQKYSIFIDWKDALNGSFPAQVYEPTMVVYDPIDIAQV